MSYFTCEKCGKRDLDFVYFGNKDKELCEECYEKEKAQKII